MYYLLQWYMGHTLASRRPSRKGHGYMLPPEYSVTGLA